MIRVFVSSSGRHRLDVALSFARARPRGAEMLVLGASREAADDWVRELTRDGGATFGIHRASPIQLAARLAVEIMAELGLGPATGLAVQAVAARAAFEVKASGALQSLEPVISFPGFPSALAATLGELRGARVPADALAAAGAADLALAVAGYDDQLRRGLLADSAVIFELATRVLEDRAPTIPLDTVLLLDVPIGTARERDFHAALIARAGATLATVPSDDEETLEAFRELGAECMDDDQPPESTIERLRTHLFSESTPPRGEPNDAVQWFSAPGEAREAVEIARRTLDAVAEGVPLDRIAVFLRSPETYVDHLTGAFRRAGLPAYFARGARRPDPSGRAFLALIACRSEGLSAWRFAEYLSFGEVPELDPDGAPPSDLPSWVAPVDEILAHAAPPPGLQLSLFDEPEVPTVPGPVDTDDRPTLAGTLRAPWKWEELLVEAAVIGGRDRWQRRLSGLKRELELKRRSLLASEPDAPHLRAAERDLLQLGHLERFALPVIEALDALPFGAPWGQWLDALTALAPRVLRRPIRVLETLAEMRPMATVGPIGIEEVQVVLEARLASLESEAPAHRFGRVFVGPSEAARGRSFDVVFVPGLAERSFPCRPREDPLLLDHVREQAGPALARQDRRVQRERLRLELAVGAAERRLVFSYPRIDGAEGRPRVPSFYGLDLVRAATGELPDPEQFERDAAAAGAAHLAWPAPDDPERALDAIENDLAVLGDLFRRSRDPATRGRARYLFGLNPHLARSLRARRARWRPDWEPQDGLVRSTPEIAAALAAHAPGRRVYSVTSLERFATCPYQFLLGTIHRLEPREEPVAIVQLDPLVRGSIIHEVLSETVRDLERAALLPVTAERLEAATEILDAAVGRVGSRWRDDLAPAIPRVWDDEMREIRVDARRWLSRMVEEASHWVPLHVEYRFGLGEPASGTAGRREPVTIDDGWRLHGAVDKIDRAAEGQALRVTDYKTGYNRYPRCSVLAGGRMLQPMLYAMAVERMLDLPVSQARLDFCTTRGGFAVLPVDVGPFQRSQAALALGIIGEAIAEGRLHPAPIERACSFCDFRPVCGPTEQTRWQNKPSRPLAPLLELRGLQ